MFVGFLVFTNKLHLPLTAVSAFLGSVCGISVSYLLGRWIGRRLLATPSRFLRFPPKALEYTESWFERKGKYALLFGYFLPGIRHFTAFVAGTSKLPLPTFAIFAYSGALLWSLCFILVGYGLGEEWHRYSETISQISIGVAIGVISLVALWLVIRTRFSLRN